MKSKKAPTKEELAVVKRLLEIHLDADITHSTLSILNQLLA